MCDLINLRNIVVYLEFLKKNLLLTLENLYKVPILLEHIF